MTGIILLIEDNKEINNANREELALKGYIVHTAITIKEARSILLSVQPDVIVLDIMLPDGSGLDFVAEIRKTCPAPVLFLTALGDKQTKLDGLLSGGDDYITKPYFLDELIARIAAVMRRVKLDKAGQPNRLIAGKLMLDIPSARAYCGGNDLLLMPKEFSVLLLLVQSEGKLLSADKLYEAVWKQQIGSDDHSIKNTVYRLRKKLEAVNGGLTITTSRGKGYSLKQK